MGLFHYQLIIKAKESISYKEIDRFLKKNQFSVVCETNDYVSYLKNSDNGVIEVLVDKQDNEFSMRTKIQNNCKIIDTIFSILLQFSTETKNNISVYDVQNKQIFEVSDIAHLKELYLKRQDLLKKYF